MAQDLKYIDKIVGDSLKGYVQSPETNWAKFETKFSNNLNQHLSSTSSSYGIAKNIVLSVVSLSVLTTGVFLHYNKNVNKTETPICKTATTKQIKFSNELNYKVKPSSTTKQTDSMQIKETNISPKSENVVIRVEVPVYKKIELRKEIIINDTIN